ncbi:crosslink repair DNA glycosylase YcaQ family protein [Micromonospora sp. NPDC050686]|uniref:DNA glycosylase AlkZ-like family protein n=1 Tax=Micromonospora sp. NPDC050686 TaxID=3154631 RepID=UPI0034034C91
MAPAAVGRDGVTAFRLRAQHLQRRLPAASHHRAAARGLQDGAPRSALLSLHARADGVGPDTWADSAFTQVWGPRGAVCLVPVEDVAVFTLGLLPRNERRQRSAQEAADAVRAAVGDRQVRKREVLTAVGNRVDRLILACATGQIRIRWDGRDTLVSAAEAPRADPDEARVELLRRFLGGLGPSTADGFAAWTGLSVTDARTTFAALADELTEVTVAHGTRMVLSSDHDSLVGATDAAGVRLLPPGDPYLLAPDRELLVPEAAHRTAVWPAGTVQPGALLADGELLGTWRRRGHQVGITTWAEVDERVRTAAEREAAGFPLGLNRDIAVTWARR